MKRLLGVVSLALVTAITSGAFSQEQDPLPGRSLVDQPKANRNDDNQTLGRPPADASVPPGELGKFIRLGETLVNETSTHPLSAPFVGNRLNCTSCHLEAGRHPKAASFVGVAAAYPAFSPRESTVITLEDRILNCFIRSQNGTRPPNGHRVPVAIAAYITWLSEGTPIRMNPSAPLGPNHLLPINDCLGKPNPDIGRQLYEDRCSGCHNEDGSGSDDGPPVWGSESFNDGAGLSKVPKMASWLKVAMPPDETDLTDQETLDLAAYINSHERPHFHVGGKDTSPKD